MTPPPSSARSQFFLGARSFIPIAISIASYGVVWGVLAGQAGLTPLEVALMSGLVYAGSSQFVALTLWSPGALPIGAIVFAVAIVNLRMMLMSATLRPLMQDLPRWQALPAMFLVSDEVWAITIAENAKGRGSVGFFLGAGTLAWCAWLGSTLGGRLLGAVISDPRTYGLDFAFTATFLALLFGMWKGKSDLVPWLAGALIAILVAQLLPGTWYIIAGGIGGSLIGALVEDWRLRHVA
ncbi:MAG: AzlC family ABC transporter permease [Devosia sp.]